MNKEILKLCEKDKYQKIYLILKSRMNNEELNGKYIVSDIDINNLRGYFTNRILKFLYKNNIIPQTLINTSIYLGKQHMNQIKELICNYIIVYNSTELGYFIAQNFDNLDSLHLIYKELEKLIIKITEIYDNLPKEWNIELKFIKKAYFIIKQRICDYFFIFEPDEISFTNGFLATIKFEKLIKSFFENKKCCMNTEINNTEINNTEINNTEINNTEINVLIRKVDNTEIKNIENKNNEIKNNLKIKNNEVNVLITEVNNTEIKLLNEIDYNLIKTPLIMNSRTEIKFDLYKRILSKSQILLNKEKNKTIIHSYYLPEEIGQIECKHYNIISTLLLANVSLYYEYIFKFFENEKYNQKFYEFGIIKIFPDFFRKVENVYECIEHFNDINVFTKFLNYVDYYLFLLCKQIKIIMDFDHGTSILSTIFYIRETMENLINKNNKIDIELSIFSLITEIEKNQNLKLEIILNTNFVLLNKKISNFFNLKNWFEKFIFYKEFINDDIRFYLVEMSLGILFGKISQFKMSSELADLFFNDIIQLESFLGNKYEAVPHLKGIKAYLKIFRCSTTNKEKYIKMFIDLSKNTFNFTQILYAMEDQKEAMKLFTEFKHHLELDKIIFEL